MWAQGTQNADLLVLDVEHNGGLVVGGTDFGDVEHGGHWSTTCMTAMACATAVK